MRQIGDKSETIGLYAFTVTKAEPLKEINHMSNKGNKSENKSTDSRKKSRYKTLPKCRKFNNSTEIGKLVGGQIDPGGHHPRP